MKLQHFKEIELHMTTLLSSLKWESGSRGLGRFNDAAEFFDKLLEEMDNIVCINQQRQALTFNLFSVNTNLSFYLNQL